jgi:integrase
MGGFTNLIRTLNIISTIDISTSHNKPAENADKSKSACIKTPVANLIKYKPSGVYFARVRLRNRLYRASLKTTVMSVAKRKLIDFVKERQAVSPDGEILAKMTMGDAMDIKLAQLKCRSKLKESSKQSRRFYIRVLRRKWPELEHKLASKVTRDECLVWAESLKHYGPSYYNGIVTTLRMLFDIAIEKGARVNNPASRIELMTVPLKELDLPSPERFEQFVQHMENAEGALSKHCANLVRFLAYSGCRLKESRFATWQDVSFEAGTIRVRVTKNGKPRSVPMIGEMRELLARLKSERPEATAEDPLMVVNHCEESMTRAAKKVPGMHRITHHDLRHLFATRCIEFGVDIPTVSRWLGHQDGGALAMKVYGHLRDKHSANMASKVSFSVTSSVGPAVPGADTDATNTNP